MYTDGWRLHRKVIKLIKVVLLVLLMILKGDNNFETPCIVEQDIANTDITH